MRTRSKLAPEEKKEHAPIPRRNIYDMTACGCGSRERGNLLGDRIAPQTTLVSRNPRHKNVIVVNYGDRRPDEPMTAQPSVGKSVYLKLDAKTVRWGIVVPGFEGESR